MKIFRDGKEYELDYDELRQAEKELEWLNYRNATLIPYANKKGYGADIVAAVYEELRRGLYHPPSEYDFDKFVEPMFKELGERGEHRYFVEVEFFGHVTMEVYATTEDEAMAKATHGDGSYDWDTEEWDTEKVVSAKRCDK